ncbi:hypothetical protein [Clostridium sp.]
MPVISLCVFYYPSGSSDLRFEKCLFGKKIKNCKYVKPNEIFHRLISRTAEKDNKQKEEKENTDALQEKLDSGKQEKKENAVERSVKNIRTDSAEEALPYELVIVEAEKK